MPSSPSAAAARGAPVPWKAVALPIEHGGWGLLAEPLALGSAVAPSLAGALLAASALAAFLSRHPLRLVFTDRRKGARYPRTVLAEAFFAGYAGVALLLLAAAFSLDPPAFWPALLAAAPFALVVLAADGLGRGRDALAEAAGAIALSGSAAAIALAGGASTTVAFSASGLLASRALGSVLYVRARIRLDRSKDASRLAVLAGHAAALGATVLLSRAGLVPWLAVAAFFMLLARAAWGLSPRRSPIRPQRLGFQELGFGLLTVLFLAMGYRAGI